MMAQIDHLGGSNQTSSNDTQHQTFQEVGEIKVVEERLINSRILSKIKLKLLLCIDIHIQSHTFSGFYHLKMLENYQPPKFQQFNGKENLRQHVVHFVETCNSVYIDDYLIVNNLFDQ